MKVKCFVVFVILVVGLSLASGAGLSSSGSVSSGSGMSSSGTGSSSTSGTGNTPWQEGVIEGLKIGFHMGQMYALANQGQNISGFNAEVDKYNAWIQKNFGDNASLLMPKTIAASGTPIPGLSSSMISPDVTLVAQRKPFNASSELGKFGKQKVFAEISPRAISQEYAEAMTADWVLRNF